MVQSKSEKKSEQDLLIEISEKLDKLIGLFAVQGKPENKQIEILRGLGFDWKLVGVITGLAPDTARMRLKK